MLGADSSIYLAGRADAGAPAFPVTPGALDTTPNGQADAFVTKVNPSGSGLSYSTLLGGSSFDEAQAVEVDADGRAHVTGTAESDDFPVTGGAFDTEHAPGQDAFVAKLEPSGSSLDYSTFLGAAGSDLGLGLSLAPGGDAYVTGLTTSIDFPTTPDALASDLGGAADAFLTRLDVSGSSLDHSTYLGGQAWDVGWAVAQDASQYVYVTGGTASLMFPTTAGAWDRTQNDGGTGGTDVFATKLDASLSSVLYSTYLGGSGGLDTGFGIAVDADDVVHLSGLTDSPNFPTSGDAIDQTNAYRDAFVTKLEMAPIPPPVALVLAPVAASNTVGTAHTVTVTPRDAVGAPVPNVRIRFSVSGTVTAFGECTTSVTGSCSFTYDGPQLVGGDVISAFADLDEDGAQDGDEPAAEATKTWLAPEPTSGRATGAGDIARGPGGAIAFSFSAKGGSRPTGTCQVVDASTAVVLKCLDVTSLVVNGNQVRIYGRAKQGQIETAYLIVADDNANPGRLADTFSFTTASGYSLSGTLASGNVKIRP